MQRPPETIRPSLSCITQLKMKTIKYLLSFRIINMLVSTRAWRIPGKKTWTVLGNACKNGTGQSGASWVPVSLAHGNHWLHGAPSLASLLTEENKVAVILYVSSEQLQLPWINLTQTPYRFSAHPTLLSRKQTSASLRRWWEKSAKEQTCTVCCGSKGSLPWGRTRWVSNVNESNPNSLQSMKSECDIRWYKLRLPMAE